MKYVLNVRELFRVTDGDTTCVGGGRAMEGRLTSRLSYGVTTRRVRGRSVGQSLGRSVDRTHFRTHFSELPYIFRNASTRRRESTTGATIRYARARWE